MFGSWKPSDIEKLGKKLDLPGRPDQQPIHRALGNGPLSGVGEIVGNEKENPLWRVVRKGGTIGKNRSRQGPHFAPTPYSSAIKPVALPPGRAKLSTKPAPTGSGVCVNTIGTVRVACCSDGTTAPPPARMTSGASAANSAAYLRMSLALPAAQRYSIRTLRPSVQPNCCSACKNTARRA